MGNKHLHQPILQSKILGQPARQGRRSLQNLATSSLALTLLIQGCATAQQSVSGTDTTPTAISGAETPIEFLNSVFELPNLPFEIPETSFTDEYVDAYDGKFTFETDEVIELGSILIALAITKKDGWSGNWYVDTPYFEDVRSHFSDHMDHPIFDAFAELNLNEFNVILGLRESGYAYHLENGALVNHEFLLPWRDEERTGIKNLLLQYKEQIEDFAKKSDYESFYAQRKDYYDQLAREIDALVPLTDIIEWLNAEFPIVEYTSARILFSPLIRGTHSANAGYSVRFNQIFTMNAGPEYVRDYSDPDDRSIIMTRQIFTEIDHNYTDLALIYFLPHVVGGFSDLSKWTHNEQGQYANPPATFSEYITWSAFLLFARDYWEKDAYLREEARVFDMMENSRKFYRFGAFHHKLEELYDNRKEGEVLAHLTPAITDWAKTVEFED